MSATDSTTGAPQVKKLPLTALTAMVVGSMVGAGVFSLPRNFGEATGVFGGLIAWLIAGTGMLMLAFVFQTLAVRKPDLNAGVYAYAKAGFGEYLGFFSAFGYWASACVGNVSYWVLVKSTLGKALPFFGEGNTVIAVAVSSVGIWLFHILIMRGVQDAAFINRVVTVAKIVPIVLFVILVAVLLKTDVFRANLWGGAGSGPLFGQVRDTMLATVFVFLGVEGASVYSRYARKRQDVGKATVIGFLSVLLLFALVSILSYGILSRSQLGGLRQPSMAGVLDAAVGQWGTVLIGTGLIISVLGAYLAWTLMAAEVLFVAAKDKDMPAFLARSNKADVPRGAMLMTSGLIQIVLLVTLFSDDAFTFTLKLCSSLSLIPYLLAAGYALLIAARKETYDLDPRGLYRELTVAAVATLYTAFLLYAAGIKFLLFSCIIYAPGTYFFHRARKEQGRRFLSAPEAALFTITVIGAILGIAGLATGRLTI